MLIWFRFLEHKVKNAAQIMIYTGQLQIKQAKAIYDKTGLHINCKNKNNNAIIILLEGIFAFLPLFFHCISRPHKQKINYIMNAFIFKL